jgi:putative dimethyl sulfoxide reductase chaperone
MTGMGAKSCISGLGEAEIAGGRAQFYGLLGAVFGRIPDTELIVRIRAGEFERMLEGCAQLAHEGFRSGLGLIVSYTAGIQGRPDQEVLTELSVDRTGILRGTGHPDLKPPYEGLYTKKTGMGDSVLEVRRFYRKEGLLPDESVPEPADFLCVELDFMRQLCMREHAERSKGTAVAATIAAEREFLERHLGHWVGDFCKVVKARALTGFYKGMGLVLNAFVRTEMEWLAGR